MGDMECPYCGEWQDVCHDDGHGYDEGKRHGHQCSACDNFFVFETEISFSYTPYKADCLNGTEHEWEPTHTTPRKYTQMECSCCWQRRMPTPDERLIYEIPAI